MTIEVKVVKGDAADGLKNLENSFSNKVAKIGWFPSARYEDGTPVAYIATIQEFGAPSKNIPSRSFIRSTISEKEKAWNELALAGAKKILKGETTSDTVLELLGEKVKGDIKEKITTLQEPALKNSTIKARLRKRANKSVTGLLTKPLIDSGLMLATLSSKVEQE